MAPWVRRVFIHILPRLLVMRRPHYQLDSRSHRVMVRTCNGLELRDSGLYHDASELVDDPTGFFPNASSIDELTPRELEAGALRSCSIHGTTPPPSMGFHLGEHLLDEKGIGHIEDHLNEVLLKDCHPWHHCPEVHKAIDGVRFIADHTRREEDSTKDGFDDGFVKAKALSLMINVTNPSLLNNSLFLVKRYWCARKWSNFNFETLHC
ncbi:unnamed protein product [Psylliodes chrysocephalus]|uniref:Uncharacterized protein n=1 Tax=Psylliodes chrysocephalus TaxID=3402493 RepID=A0A9P0CHP0_9CUCU|nr:unnamed protein product [Psylliodes chrysocephala]